MSANEHDLLWSKRVLTADDLSRHLNGHRRLVVSPKAVITPMAAEHLKAEGVSVARENGATKSTWGYGQERPYPVVRTAVQALEREGLTFHEWPTLDGLPCRWARDLAECVQRGECQGGVIFCADPGLVCCVANKVSGLRAVPIVTILQAARATLTLGANLLAVELPGRTFFEVRQILRMIRASACPAGVAETLRELDGHAHR